MSENEARIGHNHPPAYDPDEVARIEAEVNDFADAAGAWLDLKSVETEEAAGRLADFIAGCRKKLRAVDERRREMKKPHDDAAASVQAAFRPLTGRLDQAMKRVQPMLTRFLEAEDARRKAEAEERDRIAREAAEEAERRAREAEARNDVAGLDEAEAARKDAEKAAKSNRSKARETTRVKSASGGGRGAHFRTVTEVEITNLRAALIYYSEHPDLADLIRTLAEREARSAKFDAGKDSIPGCKITRTRRAAA